MLRVAEAHEMYKLDNMNLAAVDHNSPHIVVSPHGQL